MKKIILLLFLMLALISLADQRPAQIQSLESQIARQDDRDKAAVLIKIGRAT